MYMCFPLAPRKYNGMDKEQFLQVGEKIQSPRLAERYRYEGLMGTKPFYQTVYLGVQLGYQIVSATMVNKEYLRNSVVKIL